MTSRRGFLLGFSAALAAPSIVRAESLMKIWMPPAPKIITGMDLASGADETVGSLWSGLICVGRYRQQAGRIKYRYDASNAQGYTNTGSGDLSIETAMQFFPVCGVTPYPDYGIKA